MMPQTSSAPTGSSGTTSADPWASIDARGGGDGIGPTARVAGLPLVVRLVRLAARAGWRGAVVIGGDREDMDSALRRWPAPAGFTIEWADAEPTVGGRRLIPLELRGIYLADELRAAAEEDRRPEPLTRVSTQAEARAATGMLLMRTRKNIDQDGVVSYYAFRPISRAMTRILLGTPVSPNMVSLAAMGFGIAAAICAAMGGYRMVALAGVLYWFGAVVDCVDGELARLRVQGSKLGEWLDTLADDVSTYGLQAGIAIGLLRDGGDPVLVWVALGAAALGFLLNVKLYFDLHRWGMVIDTARYPWFYGTPAEGEHARKGFWARLMYRVNFLFRRDFVTTATAIVLLAGWRLPALIGSLVGVGLFATIFMVHGVVVSRQRRPGEESFWTLGYFGIKDLFTIINLIGGVAGICLAFNGELQWAGFAIFGGYLFGDALDGPVARWTGTANRFGREFDAAADHLAQAIAPAVIVYVAFAQTGRQALAVALAAALMTTASIRQARFNVAEFNNPLTYCGLPRTISGVVALSLPNSMLYFEHSPLGYNGAAAVLFTLAALNLSPIPYMTHRGRRIQTWVKVLVLLFLGLPPLLFLFARDFTFDPLVFLGLGYAMAGWIPLSPAERRQYWAEYKRWSAEVARRK